MAESIAIVNGTFVGSEERNGKTSLVLNLPSFNSKYDTKASFVEDNPHGLTANQAYTFKLRRDRPQPKYANDDPETLPQWAYYYTYMGLSSEAPPEAPESASEPRKAGAPQQLTRDLSIWRSVALQEARQHVDALLLAGEKLINSTVSILGVADAFYDWLRQNEEEPSPTEEKPKPKAKAKAKTDETPEEPPLDEEMVERNEAESRDVEEQGAF
jgi:hypothetical protein